jgi:hypothetical protein
MTQKQIPLWLKSLFLKELAYRTRNRVDRFITSENETAETIHED